MKTLIKSILLTAVVATVSCMESKVDPELIDDERIVGRWKKNQEKPFYYTFEPDGTCFMSQHPKDPNIYYRKLDYELKEGRLFLKLSNGRLDGANKVEIDGDTMRIFYGVKSESYTRLKEQ